MAGIEPHLPIIRLDENDAAAGLALSIEAHWNQNERDWRFLLTKGIIFGVRDQDRRLIATAALLPHTERKAWISMVLVTASCRRNGLATRLIDACLATATKLRLTTGLGQGPIWSTWSQRKFKGLTDAGWTIELPFQRMRFGRAISQAAELPFAVAGPEFG